MWPHGATALDKRPSIQAWGVAPARCSVINKGIMAMTFCCRRFMRGGDNTTLLLMVKLGVRDCTNGCGWLALIVVVIVVGGAGGVVIIV